ncbi:uncharacterized protein LOC113464706 isoform X2 [Ceratina calcarata]|uniref:Uncharacterized protein LOC113464706 isoform X2 n=1 Tax=Ceratina calcarata TaxID=156304 RepID=A0AAJ7S6P1_9HYME|nr:uncharacterized protein LOC113464706 isoform X2 [Ceratina calcarata]
MQFRTDVSFASCFLLFGPAHSRGRQKLHFGPRGLRLPLFSNLSSVLILPILYLCCGGSGGSYLCYGGTEQGRSLQKGSGIYYSGPLSRNPELIARCSTFIAVSLENKENSTFRFLVPVMDKLAGQVIYQTYLSSK